MAHRARLELRPVRPRAYHVEDSRRGVTNFELPVRQLRMRFDVVHGASERNGVMCEGLVTTSEPFCVFPQGHWSIFRDHFYPLTPPPRSPTPEPWLYRGRHEFDFGQIWVSVCDAVPELDVRIRQMRAVPILGMFLRRQTEEVPQILIGLRHSPLSERRIVCEADPNDAANDYERWWLEELDPR